jgi:hypothetical protein
MLRYLQFFLRNPVEMPGVNRSMETIKRYFRVERKEIAYMRFVLEAYDGIAVLKTLDAKTGLVVLLIAPGCEPDVETVVTDLQKKILIQEIAP